MGVNPYFLGNKKLRNAGVVIEYTADQIQEILKCINEPLYFIKTYLKIVNVDKGLINFDLYEYQEKLIQNYVDHDRCITLAPRQCGKTVCTCAYLLWFALFHDNKQIAIIANKGKTARGVLRKIRTMYEYLPFWIKQGLNEWNKGSIAFENGSSIFADATTASSARGDSLSILYIDECVGPNTLVTIRNVKTGIEEKITVLDLYNRFSEYPGIYTQCNYNMGEYEVLTPDGWSNFDGVKVIENDIGRKFILKSGNVLECTFAHRLALKSGMTQAKNVSIGDELSTGDIVTEIQVIDHKQQYFDLMNVEKNHQYYTNGIVSHNCAFISPNMWQEFYSSVYPTISSSKTAKIIFSSTPNGMNHYYQMWTLAERGDSEFSPFRINWDDVPGRDQKFKEKTIAELGGKGKGERQWEQEFETKFLGSEGTLIAGNKLSSIVFEHPVDVRHDGKFKLYAMPEKEHRYLAICDVSEGVEQDESTIQVFDMTEKKKQVAVYRDSSVKTNLFPHVIYKIGKFYNDAVVIVEANTYGREVLNILHYELEYENLFYGEKDFGLKMTVHTKSIGNGYMKDYIEYDNIQIVDFDTLSQMGLYVKQGNSYGASEGNHDDLVTPIVLMSYFMSRKDLYENWFDPKQSTQQFLDEKRKQIEEDLIPAGFYCNGDETINMNPTSRQYIDPDTLIYEPD